MRYLKELQDMRYLKELQDMRYLKELQDLVDQREEMETRIEGQIRPYETGTERPTMRCLKELQDLIDQREEMMRYLKELQDLVDQREEMLADLREKMETIIEGQIRPYETGTERPTLADLIEKMLKRSAELVRSYLKRSAELVRSYLADQREKMLADLREEMLKRSAELARPYAFLNADTSEVKMIFGKQEVHISNRRSCHGTKLLKSSLSLASIFVPCAGGTGHGSSQPEHQSHSEIYPSTLNVVSNCPSRGEYNQTSLTKCAEVCGSYMQDGDCAYHCMRDSSKTKLVEFCAKPKPFFDYCPEYDPVDQTIQKDMATLCNSISSRNYYNSSDIYFCDPNNCLQLHESSVRNGATTLTTLMNETTEINDGDSQEWILPLLIVLAALIAVIIIGCILFRVFVKRGIFSAYIRKMRKKRNQNEKQNVYREETITFG